MVKDNWLLSYASIEGIAKVLEGMNRRTKNKSNMNLAVVELEAFYEDFEKEFTCFFDELILYTKEALYKAPTL
jgi:acyl carrier protein phosphodiesterase